MNELAPLIDKIYHPCVLISKKRYVGWKFESADQTNGVFDAKGIETVRRDTCPAVAKVMEHAIKYWLCYYSDTVQDIVSRSRPELGERLCTRAVEKNIVRKGVVPRFHLCKRSSTWNIQ